jgi:cytochrome c
MRERALLILLVLSTICLEIVLFSLMRSPTVSPQLAVLSSGEGGELGCSSNCSVCLREGVQGRLAEDAILTILISPKALGKRVFNSGGSHHLQYVMEAANRLGRVNFIVMSQHCSVLLAAQR